MQCLVTGGAGFIGSHLVERLVAEGHHVRVLDDLSTGQLANLEAVRAQIEFMQGDIVNLDVCNAAAKDMDVVFHQAAIVPVRMSIADAQRTHEVNTTGTLNVLLAARWTKARRVVIASSAAVYGNVGNFPVTEDLPVHPISPYGITKAIAENFGLSKAFQLHEENPEVVILRYFNVYGPRQNARFGTVIPRFITAVLQHKAPAISGSGQQIRDFVYVTDVVDANMLAATYPMASALQRSTVFNIASGRWTSVNQLWKVVRWLTKSELQAKYLIPRPDEIAISTANIGKAQLLLHFHPDVELATGLRLTIDWYRDFYQKRGYYDE